MREAQLKDTKCLYVSADGDEQSTTVGEVRLESVAGGLPVRPIRSFAGQRHYPGLFWSVSDQKHLAYESLLERDRLLLADFDANVVGIAAQPLWLVGDDGGVIRRHVPDLLLSHRDGSFAVVDVKPAALAEKPEVAAVFAWTSRLCASRRWAYEVWTGADQTLLAKVRQFAGSRRRELVDEPSIEAVRSAFRPGSGLGELESATGRPRSAVRRAVLWMLWSHELWTDLTRPLSSDSILENRSRA